MGSSKLASALHLLSTGVPHEDVAKRMGGSPEALYRMLTTEIPSDSDQVVEGMIDQISQSTRWADAAIDDALAAVESSNQRIADMESRRRGKAAPDLEAGGAEPANRFVAT
ncbi:hypothetical protein [Azoarcus sp. KH32C]|uniref:hypothetical protein n=1 Tax=Azoarcus sp. KH32C TaxID=748247 RepID=UPI000686173C|nr:hypothetical protein [Azoarcus sp. KH32C]